MVNHLGNSFLFLFRSLMEMQNFNKLMTLKTAVMLMNIKLQRYTCRLDISNMKNAHTRRNTDEKDVKVMNNIMR